MGVIDTEARAYLSSPAKIAEEDFGKFRTGLGAVMQYGSFFFIEIKVAHLCVIFIDRLSFYTEMLSPRK